MTPTNGDVTIGVVGASARAAVQSLARAGLGAWAVDLFGDRDLRLLAPCTVCPVEDFPDAIPALSAAFPSGPILYVGGLENHPRIVEELIATRPLLGNLPDVLKRTRDPDHLHDVLKGTQPMPGLVPSGCKVPSTGRWLRKPLRSSSGQGIRFAFPGEAASPAHYFQEFIDGQAMSAIFVSTPARNKVAGTLHVPSAPVPGMPAPLENSPGTWSVPATLQPRHVECACYFKELPDRGDTPDEADGYEQAQLLGITEQLIGEPWLHARPFAYCGNIGPISLPREVSTSLWLSSLTLSSNTGLRGVWGMDFILKENVAFPVEVNPRYTAAVEVLELGARFYCMALHRDCCTQRHALWKVNQTRRFATPVGKAIYYAPHRIVFPQSGPWDADLMRPFDPWRVPGFADLPELGAAIEPGWPVLTFFASGSSPAECRQRLQSRAVELDSLFAESHP